MKNIERFENASQFLACYFNLDWHDDFKEPEEAVAQFIKDADRQTRAAAFQDVEYLLLLQPREVSGHAYASMAGRSDRRT